MKGVALRNGAKDEVDVRDDDFIDDLAADYRMRWRS
jgi:hypothetical protein